MANQGQAPL
jgi:hypothetical protein